MKNGKKANGTQNYICKECSKQFLSSYKYHGADPRIQRWIKKALIRNVGVRDISWIFNVSCGCVLDRIKEISDTLSLWKPTKEKYSIVQIDELWTYVLSKSYPLWFIYAYSPETSEILAFSWGDRDTRTVEKLYTQLKGLQVDYFCTDDWLSFRKVLPRDKHVIGKENTKHIEGVNTCLRARNRRFVRKTTCFSKSYFNHLTIAQAIINQRNRYHTF